MSPINTIALAADEKKFETEHRDVIDDAPLSTKQVIVEAAAEGQGVSGYETLTPWQTIKTFRIAAGVCALAAFSAATDGYQIGINGSIIANTGFVREFATGIDANGQPFLTSPIISAWSAIMSVGQIIGMTTLPFISQPYGRKVAMYWYWFILTMSITAESVGRSWPVWLVGKLLAGIGVGCLQSTIPTYIMEVAPIRIRGGLLIMYSFWFSMGQFMANVALQVLNSNNPTNWLTPIYTQWSQIGLMLIIYLILPESPAWCITRGKTEKARKVLAMLNKGVPGYDVDEQVRLLTLAVQHEEEVAAEQRNEKWYAIFKGTNGLRTVVSCWTLMTQQFTGLKLFSTFATYFFQQAGLEDPFAVTCITTGINIAAVIALILSVDFIGRRNVACSGCTLAWASCAAVGILGVIPAGRATNYLFILFACLWGIGMQGTGATGWGFLGEISSQRLRSYTAGFAAASTCVAGVVMDVLTPYMVNTNQWNWSLKTGWFYAGVGLPFTIGIWLLIPETKGRSAAELDELFEKKVKPWRFHKTQTATQRAVQAYAEDK
ncbi:Sugar (and other) transporter-like protein 33 [Elsinoe fawcettii]|nr:Sugar (and other) transporter-like protein 33 [Elsinoe fawcettii]